MGGTGSGRWNYHNKRLTAQECWAIGVDHGTGLLGGKHGPGARELPARFVDGNLPRHKVAGQPTGIATLPCASSATRSSLARQPACQRLGLLLRGGAVRVSFGGAHLRVDRGNPGVALGAPPGNHSLS
ncbi:MAG: hypothetical protein AVDCRST_MAG12-3486 [uncultured Rubrobacteraceae bacterium]|uniref:Uncharacterized protein n=1 Tax=uncultured Rubrobacteraceae bacterium TaxID=349277 RepID=A0A6J4T7X3_9ACTN|nr:MAG: hypothetical protein AVDCRST_MAG12-3486 [uncultured Rubrobacteraceae bacterium]